ncbi:N-acetyltransferase [Mediterraneibacter sp. ICN-202921]|uniref:N-acetyltransferase n=1 Tax=Mediterraneibacter sp. ICN-202921 TaxID=3134657 RepID=UPI0030BFCCBD
MIREYRQNDTESIMRIWLEGNREAHAFIPAEYWHSHYAQTKKALTEADLFLYEKEQQICGFAGMTGEYLAGIFVRKDCRCAGIGKKLLDKIKQKYPSVTLHVYQKNRRAQEFYLREGFRIILEEIDEETKEAEYKMNWGKNKS